MASSPFLSDDPFEDPDVQAASGNAVGLPPPVPPNVYDQGKAYEPPNVGMEAAMTAAQYVPAEQQKQMAMSAGSAVANKAKAEFDKATTTQQDQHLAPSTPPICVRFVQWFPLRIFAFGTGVFLAAAPILDLFINGSEFIQFFLYIYLIIFGIVMILVEAPSFSFTDKCTQMYRPKLLFWFQLLSRLWGRALLYIFISILCYSIFATIDNTAVFTLSAGIALTVISVWSCVVSRMSAKKFGRIHTFISGGAEGDELIPRFARAFDELDTSGKEGIIGPDEIYEIAKRAGRNLSTAEKHAILTFLDKSCNGFLSKEDWMNQFVTQYVEKGFKQNYL